MNAIVANRDHRGMLLSPDLWPLWPVLPLKKRKAGPNGPDLGIVLAGRPETVVMGCLGLMDLKTAARIEYGSVDDLLRDGWEVD